MMNQTTKTKITKEVSKEITHFINTYCRESSVSFYDAYEKLLELYQNDRSEFDKLMSEQECPRKVS